MKKYVYFLADAPEYPNEIYANSPMEVKSLIMESIPDESQILKIIEVKSSNPAPAANQRMNVRPQSQQSDSGGDEIDPNDYKNANDFMNAVMNSAIAKGNPPAEQAKQPKPEAIEQSQKPVEIVQKTDAKPKFFEEAGIQFKLENGRLFKRSWIDVNDEDIPCFRIKMKKTGKLADPEKFQLEKLEWVEIDS